MLATTVSHICIFNFSSSHIKEKQQTGEFSSEQTLSRILSFQQINIKIYNWDILHSFFVLSLCDPMWTFTFIVHLNQIDHISYAQLPHVALAAVLDSTAAEPVPWALYSAPSCTALQQLPPSLRPGKQDHSLPVLYSPYSSNIACYLVFSPASFQVNVLPQF